MNENPSRDDQLFIQLILTFQSAAWQALGKIKNPLTDKVERNLDQARFSIDILDMLQRKTEGNLVDPLKQMLQKSVSELQLNYVAESGKAENEKPAEPDKGDESKQKEKTEAQKSKVKKTKSTKKKNTSGRSKK